MCDSINGYNTEWTESLCIENKIMTFKCDTGAQINVLSLRDFKKLVNMDKSYKLKDTTIILEVFGGNQIKPLGKVSLTISFDNKTFKTEFIIVERNVQPILGLPSLIELKFFNINNCNSNNKVNLIKVNDQKNLLIKKHCKLFQGIGQFDKPLKLHIQSGAEPVVRPPRRVPFALKAKLEDKLNSLVDRQIISKVEHPKSFVSNLVVLEKKDGTLRICLDPKDLNNVLVREHYLIPKLEEIIPKITNKKFFSVLDLSEGFYNIKLDVNSSHLCTFNSPFGCYKFNRLPFGLSVAPEIFQKYNEKAFGDIPGVIIYCDDMLVCAESETEHDLILEKVFKRAEKCNVRFNKNKFQFKLTEVKYFGHIFSAKGMQIDPNRVLAIKNIKNPSNKKELQTFLGMVNYLRQFVQHLANIASPLQLLLKKNVDWIWTEVHEKAFNLIKEKISQAPILQNFNPSLDIEIQCDASKGGLGCCLLQMGKPVCFASRNLTASEQYFSQIEKELLSVVWATKKFHYYIYGRKVTILNDHKPLEILLNRHIHEVPSPRLQRLKLNLLKYDLDFKYLKGKLMFIADLLSRNYLECNSTDESYMFEVIHCVGLAKYLQCTNEQREIFITETKSDPDLSLLLNYTLNGWPDNLKSVPDDLKFYWKLRSDITIDEGMLFFKDRLIIPKNLRAEIILKLHEGHLGMSKMKGLARKIYYWPKIDDHLDQFVRKCLVCQTFSNKYIKEPLLSHEIPDIPFSKLGIDILEFRNRCYLVIYDYYSKWLDIQLISSKSARCINNVLIDIFCNFGCPSEIVSDHVPFDSKECKEFAKQWQAKQFQYTFTSPRYPQSNGMAERAVQTAKKMFKKCFEDKTDLRVALLQYMSAPVCGTCFSPAELLMNRNLKTKLPVPYSYLKPKLNDKVKFYFDKAHTRNVKNYNTRSKVKQGFYVGQNIIFLKDPSINRWSQGTISNSHGLRSFDLIDNNGVKYTRTSYHIRPC